MEDKKKLALLIVNHIKSQLKSGGLNDDALESLEVAVQCIESAYNLNPQESVNVNITLEQIIKEYYESLEQRANIMSEPNQSKKEEAEYHKNCGNDFMKNKNNEKAIEAYSKSIALNPINPIYYCNRAAAYNAIGKYQEAIEDCQKSIELDSTYCKAYCRLGLAFTYMKEFHKAASCYKKACELEPENEGYRKNYELTMNNLERIAAQEGHSENEAGAVPPNFMDTASRLMNDPEVTSMLNNILGGDVSNVENGGLDRLMQVGQTIVTRLQSSNPNILDGIRMQFQNVQTEGHPSPPTNGFPDDDDHHHHHHHI